MDLHKSYVVYKQRRQCERTGNKQHEIYMPDAKLPTQTVIHQLALGVALGDCDSFWGDFDSLFVPWLFRY